MSGNKNIFEFLQKNSPDGGFLQSRQWLGFQQKAGRKAHFIENENFVANVVEHMLPIVGKYFYVPRGPIFSHQSPVISHQVQEVIDLAKENNAGWIRIEPASEQLLEIIRENISEKIVKAPHDMQPKEIFVIDISRAEEQLLSEMKPKARYNIGVAKKKKIVIKSSSHQVTKEEKDEYIKEFLRLTKEMAQRHGIATHSEEYYRKMIESFPEEMLKVYVAEYEGKTIAANLVLFYGKTATYLHGASGDAHRNVMAPFLLQWQAILDAKERGCEFYDLGGVQTPGVKHQKHSDLAGVTNFKLGFSTKTNPIVFPGSYDIVINPRAYALYRGLQRAKAMMKIFKK